MHRLFLIAWLGSLPASCAIMTVVSAVFLGDGYSCNDPSNCSFTGPDGHIIGTATPNRASAEIAAGNGPNAGGNVFATVDNFFTYTSTGTGFVTVTFIESSWSLGGNANASFRFGSTTASQTPNGSNNLPFALSQIPVIPGDYTVGWHLYAQAASNRGEGPRSAFFDATLRDIQFTPAPEPSTAIPLVLVAVLLGYRWRSRLSEGVIRGPEASEYRAGPRF
jgi:hypothetical protein